MELNRTWKLTNKNIVYWFLTKEQRQSSEETIIFLANAARTTDIYMEKKKESKHWPYTFHKN